MEETWDHVSVHWQRGNYQLWANCCQYVIDIYVYVKQKQHLYINIILYTNCRLKFGVQNVVINRRQVVYPRRQTPQWSVSTLKHFYRIPQFVSDDCFKCSLSNENYCISYQLFLNVVAAAELWYRNIRNNIRQDHTSLLNLESLRKLYTCLEIGDL